MNDRPNFTVHTNVVSPESGQWIGRCWEFFDNVYDALACHERQQKAGNVPSTRPYHPNDEIYFVAVHRVK